MWPMHVHGESVEQKCYDSSPDRCLLAYSGLRQLRGRNAMFIEKKMMTRVLSLMSEDDVGLQHNKGF